MDVLDRFGEDLLDAARRRRPLPSWLSRASLVRLPGRGRGGGWASGGSRAHLRLILTILVLVFLTTAVTLAATGVILTGSPVATVSAPIPTVGEGAPVLGQSRLLALRAPDPAGGLPWGMRVTHTTRGLICVQIGRVYDGQLGELGIDGAFHNDGRFHPLPVDALPDVRGASEAWAAGNCAGPEEIYAGDSVGLEQSAASSPPAGHGVGADRREISFGLLGSHAVSVTYRSGSQTRTQPVLPGLGAFLIVQRYSSGRPLGSVSETDGTDAPGNYSGPASPNGALTAITYDYAGRTCIDNGRIRMSACGLSEVPPPQPAPLPAVNEPIHVHLQIQRHVITDVEVSFRAPYPVTKFKQDYYLWVRNCHGRGGGASLGADIAAGAIAHIRSRYLLAEACGRSLEIEVQYAPNFNGPVTPTAIGTAVIHEPPGTRALPLPRPPRFSR